MWIYREPLDVRQILAWADAHYARTGQYPDETCGRVVDAPWEKWANIDANLRRGERGLPGGWSLAQLMDELRGKRNIGNLLPHTIAQILTWADSYFARTGTWPSDQSGPLEEAPGETWHAIDSALRAGYRGLPGGSSLAKLLRNKRGVRRNGRWADLIESQGGHAKGAFGKQARSRAYSKRMRSKIERLRKGRNKQCLPPFTVKQILAWADVFFARHGRWPLPHDGLIEGTRGETWHAVENALTLGLRGLRSDSSLARLLAKYRRVPNLRALPPLSIEQILAWADDHRHRTGKWPRRHSGRVACAPQETWLGVAKALRAGRRGLPKGSSLGRLLREHRGACQSLDLAPLSAEKILEWADAWRLRHGAWPNLQSGSIPESPDDNWKAIDASLFYGHRQLPGGTTLAQLLAEHRGRRNRLALPPLTEEQILAWADAHYARHGKWPTQKSGAVQDAPGETWNALNKSLVDGRRGLSGGSSLPRLLAERRGKRTRAALPTLTVEQIVAWADGHYARHGRWPTPKSGQVADVSGETWKSIEHALIDGFRGLPGGSSLAKLLDRYRRKVPQSIACAVTGEEPRSPRVRLPSPERAESPATATWRKTARSNGRPVPIRPK